MVFAMLALLILLLYCSDIATTIYDSRGHSCMKHEKWSHEKSNMKNECSKRIQKRRPEMRTNQKKENIYSLHLNLSPK